MVFFIMEKQIRYVLESRKYRNIYIKVNDRSLFTDTLVDTPGGTMRFSYTGYGRNMKLQKAYAKDALGKPVKTKVLKTILLNKINS
jgi:hypothetical protein